MEALTLHVTNERRIVLAPPLDIVQLNFDVHFTQRPGRLSRRTPLGAFIAHMDQVIHQLFEDIFNTEFVVDRDRVGIRLEFGGNFGPQAHPMFVFRTIRDNPVQALIDLIAAVLQSEQSLMLAVWEFEVKIVYIPAGGQKRKIPWQDSAIFGKKSCVQIRNDGDDLCLWRALVVGMAYQDRRKREREHPEQKNQALKTYKKIARHGSAEQKRLAAALKHATNTETGSLEELATISNFVKRNITVVNRESTGMIEFRTIDARHAKPYDDTLYVLRDRQDHHFTTINSMTGFFACSYYCDSCNVKTMKKGDHRCPNLHTCRLCDRPPAAHLNLANPAKTCAHCFRTIRDLDCFALHLRVICTRSWRCVTCGRSYPYSHGVDKHVCGETICRICGEGKSEHHQCYNQPKLCKQNLQDGKLRFFDFEADPTEGIKSCGTSRC